MQTSPKYFGALQLFERLGNQTFFLVVQRGFSLVLPLVMIGALALLIRNLPLLELMDASVYKVWCDILDEVISGSLGIIALAVLITFSGTMTMLANQKRRGIFVSPIMAGVVSLSCFFVVVIPAEASSWSSFFSHNKGLFPALIIAVTSSYVFLQFTRLRPLQLPLNAVGYDPVVRDVLTVLPAGIATIAIFVLVRFVFVASGIEDLHDPIRHLFFIPFQDASDDLGFAIFYSGLSQFLWFLGGHGPNLLFPVEEHILVPAIAANAEAMRLGVVPEMMFTKTFFDVFTRMGGSGSTLCLIIAILLKSKDNGNRRLSLFAVLPALCNVNEPLLFGLPLVLNPLYFFPFVLTPLIQTIVAYLATAVNLVPLTVEAVNWTTPVFFSGFTATNSLSGVFLQGINLAIGTLFYLPFVCLADQMRERQGKKALGRLVDSIVHDNSASNGHSILDLPGEGGRFAKVLANDLLSALNQENQLFMVFQPQFDSKGEMITGVEALLRWQHPAYGMIAPPIPIAIALAEDLNKIDALGLFVLEEACRQRAAWGPAINGKITIAINVSPKQFVDSAFPEKAMTIIHKYDLDPHLVELEITESSILDPTPNIMTGLKKLQDCGIRIAIDDFGMGHTSLRYLRSLPVDTVKIDRSLTIGNPGEINDHIVRSVVDLSHTLGFATVVEGIETVEQRDRFSRMGVDAFQGYLFSRPLGAEDCFDFLCSLSQAKKE